MTEPRVTSHEIARLLLSLPDLPIATHAHGHTYSCGSDWFTHGPLRVGRLHHYGGDHIVIGDFHDWKTNYPNHYVTELYVGDLPGAPPEPYITP